MVGREGRTGVCTGIFPRYRYMSLHSTVLPSFHSGEREGVVLYVDRVLWWWWTEPVSHSPKAGPKETAEKKERKDNSAGIITRSIAGATETVYSQPALNDFHHHHHHHHAHATDLPETYVCRMNCRRWARGNRKYGFRVGMRVSR